MGHSNISLTDTGGENYDFTLKSVFGSVKGDMSDSGNYGNGRLMGGRGNVQNSPEDTCGKDTAPENIQTCNLAYFVSFYQTALKYMSNAPMNAVELPAVIPFFKCWR